MRSSWKIILQHNGLLHPFFTPHQILVSRVAYIWNFLYELLHAYLGLFDAGMDPVLVVLGHHQNVQAIIQMLPRRLAKVYLFLERTQCSQLQTMAHLLPIPHGPLATDHDPHAEALLNVLGRRSLRAQQMAHNVALQAGER